MKQSQGEEKKIMDFQTGTTTLAFVFQGGILVAVDSRATMGSFIANENVKKIIPLSSKKLGTIAGGAADCQYWLSWLSQEIRMFELRNGKEPSTRASSRQMVNLINYYKRYGLSMGMMFAGIDDNGPNLYYIDTEARRTKGHLFSVGSGMTYAYGVLDTYYRYDMTVEEAVELGRRAIYHATNRDTASGGHVNVYHLNKEGWVSKIDFEDVNALHYKYRESKGLEEDK